jgi:hypothetical protein
MKRAGKQARLDCFVARAPRNDGVRLPQNSPRHCAFHPRGPLVNEHAVGWAKPTRRANARRLACPPRTWRHSKRLMLPVGTAQGRLCPPYGTRPKAALILRSRALARRLEGLILRSRALARRLEGWPRVRALGPSFETHRCAMLLRMRGETRRGAMRLRTLRHSKGLVLAFRAEGLDCFVARAPRNDGERLAQNSPRHCERSEAIQEPRKRRRFVGYAGWDSTRKGVCGMPSFAIEHAA